MQRTLSPDEIAARKEKRARQAQENAVRYHQEQQAMLDKTARLRARDYHESSRGMSRGSSRRSRKKVLSAARLRDFIKERAGSRFRQVF
jgi:hypothetical protein